MAAPTWLVACQWVIYGDKGGNRVKGKGGEERSLLEKIENECKTEAKREANERGGGS